MNEPGLKTRKTEILEIALKLFMERGFDATPTSAIAVAANISKANVYHHFRSKDAILWALFEPSFGRVEELIGTAPDADTLLEGYLDIMLENRELAAFLANDPAVRSHPGVGEKAEKLIGDLRDLVAGKGADLEGRMWAECALGVLRSMIISFPDVEDETVRRVGLEAARKLLATRESSALM